MRDENTQIVFKDFLYYNEEYEAINNLASPPTSIKPTNTLKKEQSKKDLLSSKNTPSSSSYNLLKKESIKKITANPMPSLVVNNMFDRLKMEKSSSLLDNRILKLKQNSNSFSSSNIMKSNRSIQQINNISNSGSVSHRANASLSSTASVNSLMASHKRTGSTKTGSIGSTYKL